MNKVEKAIVFATKAHAGAVRKGTNSPYILHLIETLSIVMRHTDKEDVLTAAVLHDTVEDTSVTIKEIETEFGARVAELVASLSEDKMKKMPPEATWKARKWSMITKLKDADHDTKLIVLADKLSNMRDLTEDYEEFGEEVWGRFNQKDPEMHLWYYDEIYKILADDCFLEDTEELLDYGELVNHLRYQIDQNRKNE